MPDLKEHDPVLDEIAAAWDKAERDIKIAEQISQRVVFPSIKELRYAGRRLVDLIRACNAGDAQKAQRLLADALFDCYRARHDAIDVAVATVAVELQVVAKTLGYHAVLPAFPKYPELLRLVQSAQGIANSRERRDDREAIYSAVEAAPLDQIVALYNEFKASEPLMTSLARNSRRGEFIGYTIGVVGVIVGVLGIFF